MTTALFSTSCFPSAPRRASPSSELRSRPRGMTRLADAGHRVTRCVAEKRLKRAEKCWVPAAQPLRSATYVEADFEIRLLLEVSRDKVRPSVNGSVAQPSRHARGAGSCRRAAPGCCAAIAVERDRRGAVL